MATSKKIPTSTAAAEKSGEADVSVPHVAAVWWPLSELVPWARNDQVRVNDHKILEMVASIRRWGFGPTIIAWRDAPEHTYPTGLHQAAGNRISVGHLRRKSMLHIWREDPGFVLEGAPAAGFVPVRFMRYASEGEFTTWALRDNNGMGEWNEDELNVLLAEAAEDAADLSGLGWSDDEINKMIQNAGDDAAASGEGEGHGAGEGDSKLGGLKYQVIVECADERDQAMLITELEGTGRTCKPLML